MKFDLKEVYEDRIKQIDIDIKKLAKSKNWDGINSLRAERKRIKEQISMMG